jgi:hypothetical protein
MKELETPYGQVALKFAIALLNGDFEDAHSFLGSAIRDEWTPVLLQETYKKMVEHFYIPPTEVSVDVVDTIEPDSAWVYVSFFAEGNAEAVTVIIDNENDKYLIQELEWGRP